MLITRELERSVAHYPGPNLELGDENLEITIAVLVRAGRLEVLEPRLLN
ncbi:MAG: hypothetical protein AAF517_12830 [Planctomycetota bacterium]